jgi:hypothetical protein
MSSVAVSIAVKPPPTTPAGRRTWRFASDDVFAAPVSCSAIKKSDALRMPRIKLFSRSMIVGLPAPVAIAICSKPRSHASSIVTVPPNRTPP